MAQIIQMIAEKGTWHLNDCLNLAKVIQMIA